MAKKELEESMEAAESISSRLVHSALNPPTTPEEIEKLTDELAYHSQRLKEVAVLIDKALKGYGFVLRRQKGQAFKAVAKLRVMKNGSPHLGYKIEEIVGLILPEEKRG